MSDSSSSTTDRTPDAAEVRQWLFTYLQDKHNVELAKLELTDDATSIGLDSLQMEQLLGDFEEWIGVNVDIAAVVSCENLGDLLQYFEGLPAQRHERPNLPIHGAASSSTQAD